MSNFTRSRSLKSTHRKKVLQKKRPSTWTCHAKRVSLHRHTISPRVSKWCEQQRISTKSSNGSYTFQQRQTIGTISTLTTHSDTATLKTRTLVSVTEKSIFHTQSTLFLFGFLWFPCWWIGGYYLKIERDQLNIEEKQVMPIHPSLLANGKTCSKIFWVAPPPPMDESKTDTVSLFYKWNRVMSLVSVGLIVLIISLLIWYYIGYCN